MNNSIQEGFLFISKGESYIKEAYQSALRIKYLKENAHITLICDSSPENTGNVFDNIIVELAESGELGLMYKARIRASIIPYDKTFFLDSDTYLIEDCRELFSLLDFFDICIPHSPVDTRKVYNDLGETAMGCYSYNSGIMVYKSNEKTKQLFNNALRIYRQHQNLYLDDQVALMEAILYTDVKIYVLQSIYNFRTPYVQSFPGLKVKIIHGRVKDFEKTAKIINKFDDKNRVWIPESQIVLYRNTAWWFRLYMALPEQIHTFFRKLFHWVKNKT